jgi:hypothetical protein
MDSFLVIINFVIYFYCKFVINCDFWNIFFTIENVVFYCNLKDLRQAVRHTTTPFFVESKLGKTVNRTNNANKIERDSHLAMSVYLKIAWPLFFLFPLLFDIHNLCFDNWSTPTNHTHFVFSCWEVNNTNK